MQIYLNLKAAFQMLHNRHNKNKNTAGGSIGKPNPGDYTTSASDRK